MVVTCYSCNSKRMHLFKHFCVIFEPLLITRIKELNTAGQSPDFISTLFRVNQVKTTSKSAQVINC